MNGDEVAGSDFTDFLKFNALEIDVQAFKLSRVYIVDMQELCSLTRKTLWENWERDLVDRTGPERLQYALKVMANHARNLRRKRVRDPSESMPPDVMQRIGPTSGTYGDPVEQTIMNERRKVIYTAISTLAGRERDVMAFIAIGMDHSSIMEELSMSRTNFSSTLSRGRRSLRVALGLPADGSGGDDGS